MDGAVSHENPSLPGSPGPGFSRPPDQVAVAPHAAAEAIRISVVMPTTDYGEPFARCARRVRASLRNPGAADGDQWIVVFDGQSPAPPPWLAESGATLQATGRTLGPAAARNLGAEAAHGDVLLFVDADVEVATDVLRRVRRAFAADPDLCAVFGAYDDAPAAPGLVSRFRNLLHHHTHVRHAGPADTFWAGCGAMRTSRFLDLGGFDPAYRVPSIEDIELGSRARAAGGKILLDPAIACTHHKRWTLRSMIHTDVFRRAVPWTRHMLASGTVARRLNLDTRSRVSGVCAMAAALAVGLTPLFPWALVPAAACLLGLLVLNRGFYRLCRSRGGTGFAAGCFLLHWLYFLYATATFATVTLLHHAGVGRPSRFCGSAAAGDNPPTVPGPRHPA